jgi:hypothetical protein
MWSSDDDDDDWYFPDDFYFNSFTPSPDPYASPHDTSDDTNTNIMPPHHDSSFTHGQAAVSDPPR